MHAGEPFGVRARAGDAGVLGQQAGEPLGLGGGIRERGRDGAVDEAGAGDVGPFHADARQKAQPADVDRAHDVGGVDVLARAAVVGGAVAGGHDVVVEPELARTEEAGVCTPDVGPDGEGIASGETVVDVVLELELVEVVVGGDRAVCSDVRRSRAVEIDLRLLAPVTEP